MDNQRKVIALGFFDGVHLGHGALLRRVAQRARALLENVLGPETAVEVTWDGA